MNDPRAARELSSREPHMHVLRFFCEKASGNVAERQERDTNVTRSEGV